MFCDESIWPQHFILRNVLARLRTRAIAVRHACGKANKSSKTLNECWLASAMRSTAGRAQMPLIFAVVGSSELDARYVELVAGFL